ncbi:hypothetical protein ACJD0Z_17625 [Flavobacteriaceae bacterium M23B6Z8]
MITTKIYYLHTFIFICWGCIILILMSCSNEDPKAPPITAENTFSCKINGELFVPEDRGGFPVILKGITTNLTNNNSWLFIFRNQSRDIFIYITDVIETGEYLLTKSEGNGDFFGKNKNLMEMDVSTDSSDISHISSDQSGKIKVLELELNKRIILQFDEIILEDKNDPEKTIVLTEGKLNINLETFFEDE